MPHAAIEDPIMKKLTSIIAGLALVLVAACAGSEASLQKYYIDSQDNKNFLSVDITGFPSCLVKVLPLSRL